MAYRRGSWGGKGKAGTGTVAGVYSSSAGANPRAHQGEQGAQQLEVPHEGGEISAGLGGDQRQFALVGALYACNG